MDTKKREDAAEVTSLPTDATMKALVAPRLTTLKLNGILFKRVAMNQELWRVYRNGLQLGVLSMSEKNGEWALVEVTKRRISKKEMGTIKGFTLHRTEAVYKKPRLPVPGSRPYSLANIPILSIDDVHFRKSYQDTDLWEVSKSEDAQPALIIQRKNKESWEFYVIDNSQKIDRMLLEEAIEFTRKRDKSIKRAEEQENGKKQLSFI